MIDMIKSFGIWTSVTGTWRALSYPQHNAVSDIWLLCWWDKEWNRQQKWLQCLPCNKKLISALHSSSRNKDIEDSVDWPYGGRSRSTITRGAGRCHGPNAGAQWKYRPGERLIQPSYPNVHLILWIWLLLIAPPQFATARYLNIFLKWLPIHMQCIPHVMQVVNKYDLVVNLKRCSFWLAQGIPLRPHKLSYVGSMSFLRVRFGIQGVQNACKLP